MSKAGASLPFLPPSLSLPYPCATFLHSLNPSYKVTSLPLTMKGLYREGQGLPKQK